METIRKAVEGDFPAVFALFCEFAEFQRTPEKLHITLEQLRKDAGQFQCFVAVVDDRIVGFATYSPVYYSWTGRAIYLDDLYVQQAFRKSGIGKRLLEAVLGLARETGCVTVRWLVTRWNENAIDFYKRLGASVQETEMVCVLTL